MAIPFRLFETLIDGERACGRAFAKQIVQPARPFADHRLEDEVPVLSGNSSGKPRSLTWHAAHKSRHSYSNLLKMIWANFQINNCLDLAAQMSFFFVLALFPFLLVVAAIIGWLPSTDLWHNFAQWITDYLPSDSRRLVFATILDLTRSRSGFLSFGLIGMVWAASGGFTTLMAALDVAYEVEETRGFWRRRAIAVCGTALSGVFFVASFGVLTFGHWSAARLVSGQAGSFLRLPLEVGRWLVTLLLMCLALDLVNHFLPNLNRPWRWITPGRLLVATMLVVASMAFNLYVRYFANYPHVYGALAGFIILMVWVYVASLILLVGAETDRAIERLKEQGEYV
jgi:membrane protein